MLFHIFAAEHDNLTPEIFQLNVFQELVQNFDGLHTRVENSNPLLYTITEYGRY